MEKVKIIVSKLKENINQLDNEELVTVYLSFYKNLQSGDDKIVKEILSHEGNKVISKELVTLSKLNGNYNIFEVN